MLTSRGTLEYDPNTYKNSDGKWWLILKCDEELTAYYRSMILKNYYYPTGSDSVFPSASGKWTLKCRGSILNRSLWGSHVSVVRGEKPKILNNWKKHYKEEVGFSFDPENIFCNGKHWWINIESQYLIDIRRNLGLSDLPKTFDKETGSMVNVPLHLTIGTIA